MRPSYEGKVPGDGCSCSGKLRPVFELAPYKVKQAGPPQAITFELVLVYLRCNHCELIYHARDRGERRDDIQSVAIQNALNRREKKAFYQPTERPRDCKGCSTTLEQHVYKKNSDESTRYLYCPQCCRVEWID